MKGTNQLIFSQATMKEAMQKFLDENSIKSMGEVTHVAADGGTYNDETFKITIEEKEEKKNEQP